MFTNISPAYVLNGKEVGSRWGEHIERIWWILGFGCDIELVCDWFIDDANWIVGSGDELILRGNVIICDWFGGGIVDGVWDCAVEILDDAPVGGALGWVLCDDRFIACAVIMGVWLGAIGWEICTAGELQELAAIKSLILFW